MPWIQRAPAFTAATALAVASPKSLCPWKWIGTSGPDPLARPADELRDRLRPGDADRVDDDDLRGSCLDGRGVRGVVEVRLGTGRVDSEVRDVDAVLHRVGDGGRDPLQHLLARHAERPELELRDRRLDHAGRHAELDERLDVGLNGAREAPDLGVETGPGDQLDGLPVVGRDPREAGLDPLDAGLRERAGDLELLLRHEDDADRLLTVPERRVVEADLRLQGVAAG